MLEILAVDDERPNLETIRRVFRRKFEVSMALSGEEGLALLGGRLFDLALVDYSMPGMNGLCFAAQARRVQPDLPILIVTGYGDRPELSVAVDEGLCIGVLAKPWSPAELEALVLRHARARALAEPLR